MTERGREEREPGQRATDPWRDPLPWPKSLNSQNVASQTVLGFTCGILRSVSSRLPRRQEHRAGERSPKKQAVEMSQKSFGGQEAGIWRGRTLWSSEPINVGKFLQIKKGQGGLANP